MAFAFDTLAYARRLRDGGVSAEDAEVHADAAREFIMTEVATRSDLEVLRRELETSFAHRFDRLETSFASDVQRLETSFASDVQRLETSFANDIQRLETSLSHQVGRLEAADDTSRRAFQSEMRNLEARMTIKMGVMFATAIGILAAIIKL